MRGRGRRGCVRDVRTRGGVRRGQRAGRAWGVLGVRGQRAGRAWGVLGVRGACWACVGRAGRAWAACVGSVLGVRGACWACVGSVLGVRGQRACTHVVQVQDHGVRSTPCIRKCYKDNFASYDKWSRCTHAHAPRNILRLPHPCAGSVRVHSCTQT